MIWAFTITTARGGVEQDLAEAMQLLQHSLAQAPATAMMWYEIARMQKPGSAAEQRAALEEALTAQQIADAQGRAQACTASGYAECD